MPSTAQPLYFGAAGTECFGWLHRPASGLAASTGLVICSPIGPEDQAAYRTLRQIAIEVADAGIPALRFDYPGSGDSAGNPQDLDHPSAWRQAVDQAIALMREQVGVARVCVLGARLGALPAAQAASERDDVSGFIALAPVLRGRSFVREALLRSTQAPVSDDAGFEYGGHVLGARARAELGALDLRIFKAPPASRVLIVAPASAELDRWRERISEQGVATSSFLAPGVAGWQEGEVTVVREAVDPIVQWTRTRAGDERAPAPGVWFPVSVQLAAVRETAFNVVATDAEAFGILAEPTTRRVRRAVLLLNTGSARRIGASGMHVEWSRSWARAGVAVLRLDLPGLGDSAVQPGGTEGDAYLIESAATIEAGLALLRTRFGPVHCTLMGICSGAFHAYRAAVGGAAIDALVSINQAAHDWRPGMRVDRPSLKLRLSSRRDNTPATSRRERTKWRALGLGFATFAAVRDAARWLGVPFAGDVGAALQALARRGVALHLLNAEHDYTGALLGLQAGRAVANLEASGALQRLQVGQADHIFTTSGSRERLRAALDRIVLHQPLGLRAMANAPTAAVPTPASTRSISR